MFVSSRARNVLVIVVPQVLFSHGPLSNDSILEVVHHLVLRAGLDLKWTDSPLLLQQFPVQRLLLLLQIVQSLLVTSVFYPELVSFFF